MEKTSHNGPDIIVDEIDALVELKTAPKPKPVELTVRYPFQLVKAPTQVRMGGKFVDTEVQVLRKVKRTPPKDYRGRIGFKDLSRMAAHNFDPTFAAGRIL